MEDGKWEIGLDYVAVAKLKQNGTKLSIRKKLPHLYSTLPNFRTF